MKIGCMLILVVLLVQKCVEGTLTRRAPKIRRLDIGETGRGELEAKMYFMPECTNTRFISQYFLPVALHGKGKVKTISINSLFVPCDCFKQASLWRPTATLHLPKSRPETAV